MLDLKSRGRMFESLLAGHHTRITPPMVALSCCPRFFQMPSGNLLGACGNEYALGHLGVSYALEKLGLFNPIREVLKNRQRNQYWHPAICCPPVPIRYRYECFSPVFDSRGCKPEPPKIPSSPRRPCHERIQVQVDHLGVALERVVPVPHR